MSINNLNLLCAVLNTVVCGLCFLQPMTNNNIAVIGLTGFAALCFYFSYFLGRKRATT